MFELTKDRKFRPKEYHGKYVFPNGVVYEGGFYNGHMHGEGVLRYPGKGSFKGLWNRGNYIGGELTFEDGLVYQEEDWQYLVPEDRRFQREKVDGLKEEGLLIKD